MNRSTAAQRVTAQRYGIGIPMLSLLPGYKTEDASTAEVTAALAG